MAKSKNKLWNATTKNNNKILVNINDEQEGFPQCVLTGFGADIVVDMAEVKKKTATTWQEEREELLKLGIEKFNEVYKSNLNYDDYSWSRNLTLKVRNSGIHDKMVVARQCLITKATAKADALKRIEANANPKNETVDVKTDNRSFSMLMTAFNTAISKAEETKGKKFTNQELMDIVNASTNATPQEKSMLLEHFKPKTDLIF